MFPLCRKIRHLRLQYYFFICLLGSLLFCLPGVATKTLAAEHIIEPLIVAIPEGKFLMGSNYSDNEKPVHKVSIKAFGLAKYSVTSKEFLQFTEATAYRPSGSCLFKVGSIQSEGPNAWQTLSPA